MSVGISSSVLAYHYITSFSKVLKDVIQWYAKTEEENLRTYPNSAVVNFTKRCYTVIC
jgi:hypothetical protein